MSTINLAQHEQDLKSLEQSIKQIGDRHQQMSDLFRRSQEEAAYLFHHLQQSWSDVIMLLTLTTRLRSWHETRTSDDA